MMKTESIYRTKNTLEEISIPEFWMSGNEKTRESPGSRSQ